MTDKFDLARSLAEAGIKLRSLKHGNQYTTCPNCSHNRKGAHKNLRCLSVKIDESGFVANCHHCSWSTYDNAKRETSQGNRGKRPERRDGGGYGALQRQALARWVRRG
jgi:hypothetical protein